MKTTPLDTTITSSLYRKNSSTGAKKETPTITQKIKNLKINNPFSFFHFNKKNTE
ncbi:hypothetical protein [Providencia rettgeri]|uniref:hypothetical protein n=2 Tax=Morganellaceae TaxID=1903414 RepID=UPI001B3876A1|nr:hypothetical protein [Providencia rettgeri]MBQ0350035.1 hypothetical protein [Providencia rettgeri]MBQ0406215.1 hypothetical protein [Providencia rettgeri]MCJ2227215.1 hypothetical protein [Providencia rettgeri]